MKERSRLAGVDLNLLVALDALVAEESVTRAAARVGLSQPAMSHSLARLRHLLGDRILVRAGARMLASARAKALAQPVAEGLESLEHALFGKDAFDLAKVERIVRIATADFGQLVVVPPLSMELARVAPGVALEVLPSLLPLERALVEGEVDLTLGIGIPRRRAAQKVRGVVRKELLEERFVCVVRRNHPDVKKRLSLQRYTELPHVVVSPRGRVFGAGDVALAEKNLRRRVVLAVPSFYAATHVVAGSDAILTVAARTARMLPAASFRVVEPPLALDGFGLHLLWHERHEKDELHAWLRDAIVRIASQA